MEINCVNIHSSAPIPQEGKWYCPKDITDINGFSHGVGTCAPQQGACKLTLNVKNGIIAEALVETIGCTGMTQSGAMASEILPGKTLLEALNTDLVCDAINVAMKNLFNQIVYGRTQSAFSDGGLAVGDSLEDLGAYRMSAVGTSYADVKSGVRYFYTSDGYISRLALDDHSEIIGYEYVNLGKMMSMIDSGTDANTALAQSKSKFGRFDEGVTFINPRKE